MATLAECATCALIRQQKEIILEQKKLIKELEEKNKMLIASIKWEVDMRPKLRPSLN